MELIAVAGVLLVLWFLPKILRHQATASYNRPEVKHIAEYSTTCSTGPGDPNCVPGLYNGEGPAYGRGHEQTAQPAVATPQRSWAGIRGPAHTPEVEPAKETALPGRQQPALPAAKPALPEGQSAEWVTVKGVEVRVPVRR